MLRDKFYKLGQRTWAFFFFLFSFLYWLISKKKMDDNLESGAQTQSDFWIGYEKVQEQLKGVELRDPNVQFIVGLL